MAHLFTRNLTFKSNNLSKKVTLMLTFDSDMDGLYEDFFPVVWKAITFEKSGQCTARATYTSQLFFSKLQVVDGNIIDSETCVKINVGEKTSLTEVGGVCRFSLPLAGRAGVLRAVNNTGAIQDIAVGFMTEGDCYMPTPALYFNDVGDNSHVTVKFTPILRAYITSDYRETDIIQSAMDTSAIWTEDLTALSEDTTFNLTRDSNTGHYMLTQV